MAARYEWIEGRTGLFGIGRQVIDDVGRNADSIGRKRAEMNGSTRQPEHTRDMAALSDVRTVSDLTVRTE